MRYLLGIISPQHRQGAFLAMLRAEEPAVKEVAEAC